MLNKHTSQEAFASHPSRNASNQDDPNHHADQEKFTAYLKRCIYYNSVNTQYISSNIGWFLASGKGNKWKREYPQIWKENQ